MSATQNLAYSIVQVVHNFGATAVVGGSFAAVKFRAVETRKRLVWLVLSGWLMQAVSGAAFGTVSYYYYHQFPDISGIAVDALAIKMTCVASGCILLVTCLLRGSHWTVGKINIVWAVSFTLSAVSLISAAFLRWFS